MLNSFEVLYIILSLIIYDFWLNYNILINKND